MSYSYYDEELGAIVQGSLGSPIRGTNPPVEFVRNGITYRVEGGKAYRKQNGQLIPITNQQELNALNDYYADNVYKSNAVGLVPGYVNEKIGDTTYGYFEGQRPSYLPAPSYSPAPNTDAGTSSSALVLLGVGLLGVILLSRR